LLSQYVERAGLEVDERLARFIEAEALPGTGVPVSSFWHRLFRLLRGFTARNEALLVRREELQQQIDAYHEELARGVPAWQDHQTFLEEIGYLAPLARDVRIAPSNVDPEIAAIAGPQLVVPLSNARYALNAANARWGSLYDALYGTDVLGDLPAGGGYDPERGKRVIDWGFRFLDEAVPIEGASWADVGNRYGPVDGELMLDCMDGDRLLKHPEQFVGTTGSYGPPSRILLRNHGLHIELVYDHDHPVGRTNRGLADIRLESAVTAIMDCEDSVAAVDAEDKVGVYRNWLGLMTGSLSASFDKGGRRVERRLKRDRTYTTPDGGTLTLPGRALMFVRNVGHLMRNPMIRFDGADAFEGLCDAVITSLIALHDLHGPRANSRAGSIYIVKPKMHGPEEAAFANDLFDAVEEMLGLEPNTIKIGLMDEERRTSLNLAACIGAVKDRIVFINTGFLDRTGDEIHTAMKLGPVIRKGEMKSAEWLRAYEQNNVAVGLACGFRGRAQIGKGMWAMPDRMAEMMAAKGAQLEAGASTAWVPSPTAATLHAVHYHRVDVSAVQRRMAFGGATATALAGRPDMLQVPVAADRNWSPGEVREELENNLQGILGYVVRWIDQGVGCSKVPDIHDVGLMEDRATCRISSQHVANWLRHGVVSAEEVEAALLRMAAVVDRQNAGDPSYRPIAPDPDASLAFQAARALVLEGEAQPSGYTEPLLHAFRLRLKGSG
jgi:malate synthase